MSVLARSIIVVLLALLLGVAVVFAVDARAEGAERKRGPPAPSPTSKVVHEGEFCDTEEQAAVLAAYASRGLEPDRARAMVNAAAGNDTACAAGVQEIVLVARSRTHESLMYRTVVYKVWVRSIKRMQYIFVMLRIHKA